MDKRIKMFSKRDYHKASTKLLPLYNDKQKWAGQICLNYINSHCEIVPATLLHKANTSTFALTDVDMLDIMPYVIKYHDKLGKVLVETVVPNFYSNV